MRKIRWLGATIIICILVFGLLRFWAKPSEKVSKSGLSKISFGTTNMSGASTTPNPTSPAELPPSVKDGFDSARERALEAMDEAWQNRASGDHDEDFSLHYKIFRQRQLGRGILFQFQQEYDGVPVFLSRASVLVHGSRALTTAQFGSTNIMTSSHEIVPATSADIKSIFYKCQLSADDAFQKSFSFIKTHFDKSSHLKLDDMAISSENSRSDRFLIDNGEQLVPGYVNLISFQVGSDFHALSLAISAIDGTLLYMKDHSDAVAEPTIAAPISIPRPFPPLVDGSVYTDDINFRTFHHPDGQPRIPPTNSSYSPQSRSVSYDRYWTGVWDATIATFINSRRTEGNHAIAYVDFKGETGFQPNLDIYATETRLNRFDYSYLKTLGINDSGNLKFGSVSAFYVVNYLHDLFYQSGFREDMGAAMDHNLLESTLGEEKYKENDPILIESMDSFYSGMANRKLNNANITTLPDGMKSRMQMYAWQQFTGTIEARTAAGETIFDASTKFGMPQFSTGPGSTQTSRIDMAVLMRANDGNNAFGSYYDACEKLSAAKNVIFVIDRGKCSFVDKAKNAKAAGALGAILINDSDRIQDMSGDISYDFPIIMIGKQDGSRLLKAMETGEVTAKFSYRSLPIKDGAMDAGIVAHEWGHYLTHRLVCDSFGLGNNQGKSLGEGFGDFLALLTLVRDEDRLKPGNDIFQAPFNIAEYAMSSEITGRYQRRAPYTTDKSINPLTFRHISNFSPLPESLKSYEQKENAEVHNSGEIWTLALWQVYVELLLNYDFDVARKKMTDFLVAGLAMVPCNPTFTDARNALLSAALTLGGEADFNLMSKGFAARGMGYLAKSPTKKDNGRGLVLFGIALGTVDGHAGVEESFEPITVQEFKEELDLARAVDSN